MTDKTIANHRRVGGDYFKLYYERISKKHLTDFLPLFNFSDYWCCKTTNKQKLVSYEEFIEFKHCAYTFFKKDKYEINHINKWIEWMNNMGGIQFLDKPFPYFDPKIIKIYDDR